MASLSPALNTAVRRLGQVDELPARSQGQLARFITDMDATLHEVARVLKPEGQAVLVVGDSFHRGVFVRNSWAVTHLAKHHGLQLVRRHKREIPATKRYLPVRSQNSSNVVVRGFA